MSAFMMYVRFSPIKSEAWNVPLRAKAAGTYRDKSGVQEIQALENPPSALVRLDRIIQATPRTTVLAGSVAEGMISYITRSRFWGFPDVTTVSATETLNIHARLRFGRSDFGVNGARVQGWLDQLNAG
jgi:uncharacterized protein (DUF1499 family)